MPKKQKVGNVVKKTDVRYNGIMKKGTWRKQHKWLGIGMSLFMLVFCISGILLNHRSLILDVNVSRKFLPSRYEYKNWNGGLMRGTLAWNNAVLLFGNGGIWQTDSTASKFKDFNKGLPTGADYRQIRNVIKTDDGSVWAVSPFGLYRLSNHQIWKSITVPTEEEEKLSDIAAHGDTLLVLGRSYAYVSLPPYHNFRQVELPKPKDYDGKVTAFRTVWLFHSGELFGCIGKLIVDGIAIVLVLLCITGIIFWIKPKQKALLRSSLQWHNKIGRYTILLTLLIVFTGWCLRPPVMIALVLNKIPSIPGTTLYNKNSWNDKLRMIRYDERFGDWILSTSDGFYSVDFKKGKLKAISNTPLVSVMGLNVLQKSNEGKWYCGSFSGLFVWDRVKGTAVDYFTKKPTPKKTGAPFGKKAIAGMSQDFSKTPVVAEYYDGTNFAPQPTTMTQLPMSLWNVALEAHSGRLFMGSIATYIFIFIMGILAIWCLWSGYIVRLATRKKLF